MVGLMFRRWLGLVALGLMALGPGLFWSPAVKYAGQPTGWSAAPLPQQIVDGKSFSSFSFGLAVVALVVLTHSRVIPIHKVSQAYMAPVRNARLYLFYSKLQTDGG